MALAGNDVFLSDAVWEAPMAKTPNYCSYMTTTSLRTGNV
jgi:hypothetical protein